MFGNGLWYDLWYLPKEMRRREDEPAMWLLFALLSAVFAALTSILAKVGIEGVNSNLATAIRTAVVLVMAWGMEIGRASCRERV